MQKFASKPDVEEYNYLAENVLSLRDQLSLRNEKNINGLLVEPVMPSSLVTKKFVGSPTLKQWMLKKFPTDTITENDKKQMVIDSFL